MGVAAAAAGGDVATAWKAVGGLCFIASASHFSFGLLAVVRPSPRIARDDDDRANRDSEISTFPPRLHARCVDHSF